MNRFSKIHLCPSLHINFKRNGYISYRTIRRRVVANYLHDRATKKVPLLVNLLGSDNRVVRITEDNRVVPLYGTVSRGMELIQFIELRTC